MSVLGGTAISSLHQSHPPRQSVHIYHLQRVTTTTRQERWLPRLQPRLQRPHPPRPFRAVRLLSLTRMVGSQRMRATPIMVSIPAKTSTRRLLCYSSCLLLCTNFKCFITRRLVLHTNKKKDNPQKKRRDRQ